VDVRCTSTAELPTHLVAHLGTVSMPARVRRLGGEMVRLTLDRPLPIEADDRLVLRDPGRQTIVTGAVVLDPDPPELRRRGAAAARAAALVRTADDSQAMLHDRLARDGLARADALSEADRMILISTGAVVVDGWFIDPERWQVWQQQLAESVTRRATNDPLDPRLSLDAGRRVLGVPDRQLVSAAAVAAGLVVTGGWLQAADADRLEPSVEAGLERLERQLTDAPFAAPERPELDAWGLGVKELAAAERLGRVVRLTPDVVLLPSGPALAMRTLASLPQPFTTSEARRALATTRRVAVPLLEQLDRRGWTQRLDAGHRRVVH
jgi:selenocysteine-specific elongation factor